MLQITQIASITNLTVVGGLSIDLMLFMSFGSRVSRAFVALISLGFAIERSYSHDYFIYSASWTRSFTSNSSYSTFIFLGSID
jgi:hypothetical protein